MIFISQAILQSILGRLCSHFEEQYLIFSYNITWKIFHRLHGSIIMVNKKRWVLLFVWLLEGVFVCWCVGVFIGVFVCLLGCLLLFACYFVCFCFLFCFVFVFVFVFLFLFCFVLFFVLFVCLFLFLFLFFVLLWATLDNHYSPTCLLFNTIYQWQKGQIRFETFSFFVCFCLLFYAFDSDGGPHIYTEILILDKLDFLFHDSVSKFHQWCSLIIYRICKNKLKLARNWGKMAAKVGPGWRKSIDRMALIPEILEQYEAR